MYSVITSLLSANINIFSQSMAVPFCSNKVSVSTVKSGAFGVSVPRRTLNI